MYDNDQPHVHSLTYFRIAQLQSSALFPSLRRLCYDLGDPSIPQIFLFLSPLLNSLELFNINGFEDTIVGPFLATLSSPMLSRVVLRNGAMSVDIFKKSVVHFTQLRSLELLDAVFMNGFDLWKVLGTLPSLANFTLRAVKPHRCLIPRPTPGNSSSQNQSGGPKYFDALESLSVKGSFFLIQHLLGFIDSSCLKSIEVYPVIKHDHEDEGFFTPCMTIVASKWSQSLKNLYISSRSFGVPHNAISKCLMLLTDLHEIQSFHLRGWRLENMDDDVRRLVMSWPKLRVLNLGQTLISLSTTRIIAENCPELHFLHIQLDISTFPPFDASCRRLTHNLAVLNVAGFYPSDSTITQTPECQIQMTRHLDSIFPYLKSIEVRNETWLDIYNLVKSRFCQDDRRVKPATDMVLSSTWNSIFIFPDSIFHSYYYFRDHHYLPWVDRWHKFYLAL